MKNLIYTCLSAVMVLISSCTEDFDPVFDENATERYIAQKAEFTEKLQDAEYGWVLQHFPSSGQELGGFNYYFDFIDNANVKVSSEENDVVNETLTTSYSLKGSSGVYLSLDTYNEIAHKLATPSAANYQAYGGEFEFNLLTTNNSNDTIDVIGRVTRNKMRLIKLKESWADYNQKVTINLEAISGAKVFGTLDGVEIDQVSLSGRRLGFSIGESYNEEAFIFTDRGIYFYEPIMIGATEYQELIFNAETNLLVSEDGKVEIKVVKPPINFNDTLWVIDLGTETLRSDKFYDTYIVVRDANMARLGHELLTTVLFGNYNGEVGIHYLSSYDSDTYRTNYLFDFSGNDTSKDLINITGLVGGNYWDKYFTHLTPFKNLITDNSPFKVEFVDDTKEVAKLTSTVDPDIWFYIFKN